MKRTACLKGSLVVALVLGTLSVAYATDSGWVNWGPLTLPAPYGTTNVYLRAVAEQAPGGWVQHRGYIDTDLTQPNLLPAGWIGVNVGEFKNGGFCGETGYQFSNTAADGWSTGSSLCGYPPGTFVTGTFGCISNGSSYSCGGPQYSPVLSL